MKHLSPGLQEINAEFSVCDQKPFNSVRWTRKVHNTSANDKAQVNSYLLLIMDDNYNSYYHSNMKKVSVLWWLLALAQNY